MRTLAWLPLWMSLGCMVRADSLSTADRSEILAVLEAQRLAWNQGDLDGYMAGYENSEALVFTSGGQIRRGWETTRAKYLARYGSATDSMGSLAFEVEELRGVGGDAAVVLGHWRLSQSANAGSGVFTLVFARSPSGWKVIHDHTSSAPPS